MKEVEIYKAIEDLSKSQGFYCRLLIAIREDKTILKKLAKKNFNDVVDLVLYLEN